MTLLLGHGYHLEDRDEKISLEYMNHRWISLPSLISDIPEKWLCTNGNDGV